MSKLDRDKLISAVYSATLSPANFDETLDTFDKLIFGNQEEFLFFPGVSEADDVTNPPMMDPELLVHFKTAHEIQQRIGRQQKSKPKELTLLDSAPNPAFIIDDCEKIVAMNELATNSVFSKCSYLEDCFTELDIVKDIRQYIANSGIQKLLILPGYINKNQDTNTCILVKKVDEYPRSTNPNDVDQRQLLYFVTLVDLGFDQSKTELFQTTYSLTPAELDIAVSLAAGKQLQEIAIHRSATLATIRTQFKSVKKKTNSRDISAVVRLLCGFSAGILVSSQLSQSANLVARRSSPLKSYYDLPLRDGRKMHYLEQGDPTGIPVVMIHNMPYGVEMNDEAIKSAKRLRLRIISPYRPGFGDSDLIKNVDTEQLLNEVATDIYELLDYLGISKAAIVGQTIGSVYALRFAKLFPNRVSRLFAISRAPIWRDEWIKNMPKRQRFIVRISKHVPQLLPLVTRATVMFIDNGHAKQLIHTLCKDSAADLSALKNSPEIYELMARGCEEGLKQGAEAFNLDCFLSIRDFTHEARNISHSFHILHGDADGIVDIAQSKAFVEAVPGAQLEVVKGAGQLLFYSHWNRVLMAIHSKLKS